MGWRELLPQSRKTGDHQSSQMPKRGNIAHIADIALQEDKLSSYLLYRDSSQSTPIDAESAKSAKPTSSHTDTDKLPSEPVIPPIQAGWLVVYHNAQGALCGGCLDRDHGTVESCSWDGVWRVRLTDGTQLPLAVIRAVARTDKTGQVLAAWTVREHGYDGEERS
jgi:hypothetical protein